MYAAIRHRLEQGLEFITLASMGILVLDVTWQVVTRFFLKDPSSWTEELATYLLIWVGLLGSAVALERGAHLGIDYFTGKLSPRNRTRVHALSFLLVAAFSASVMLIGGYQLVSETLALGQVAPATGIPLGYVYLAVPISGFFLTLYSIEFLLKALSDLKSLSEQA